MRIMLAIHNAYTDHTSGAAQSMRIILEWLGAAGHEVRVLCTGRFDASAPDHLEAHLGEQQITFTREAPSPAFLQLIEPHSGFPGRESFDFTLNGVPVTMIATRGLLDTPDDRLESAQFLFQLDDGLTTFAPDVLLTYGGHPAVQQAMRLARERGVRTVFSLRSLGYDDRRYFEHVDHVLTASPYLSRVYRERIGLRSQGIDSPLDWAAIDAPTEARRFVTFVNPSPKKGSLLFARLADVLGSTRPDIPLLIVQSAHSAGWLTSIPGIDLAKYSHIMAAPATPHPAAIFALTRILLMPSACEESFGRVAAEAMVNGIPPIVSDRGALPETVSDGGIIVPLPAWMTATSTDLPSADEVMPWFDAICALWDDPATYDAWSRRAQSAAQHRFAEPVMRRRYIDYFETLDPEAPLS